MSRHCVYAFLGKPMPPGVFRNNGAAAREVSRHARLRSAHRRLALGIAALAVTGLIVAGCSGGKRASESDYSPRVVKPGQPVPKGGGAYKVGRSYTIRGQTFHPREDEGYDRTGVASWYGDDFHGRLTANGEVYDMHALSAAHPTLPMPTYVRVTNLQNDRSVVVRVNDRGPFARGRIIDLSKRTAEVLDFKRDGTAQVRVQFVGRAPLDGEDDWLTTTVRNNRPDERIAAVDRQIAAKSFASDNQRGDGRRVAEIARNAYRDAARGRTTQFASAAPTAPPSPAAQNPAAAAPPVQEAGAVVIQAGLFSNEGNARQLAQQLDLYGRADVYPVHLAGDVLYGVTLTSADGVMTAGEALQRVQAAGASSAYVLSGS